MLDKAQFIDSLNEVFRSELDDESILVDFDTTQEDILTWDSLAHVRIVMGVENVYGIQLDVEEIESINSVRGFYEAVARHKG